jgi:hypothetical protein
MTMAASLLSFVDAANGVAAARPDKGDILARVPFVRSLTAIVVCSLALILVAQAAAEAPPSLVGEHFAWVPNPTDVLTANCDPFGTSTVSWSTSGIATGPYPGTFTTTGSATFGPISGFPIAFSESFRIDSPLATVRGQTINNDDAAASTTCNELLANVAVVPPGAYYAAVIIPVDGGPAYIDNGLSYTYAGGLPSGTLFDYQKGFDYSFGVAPFVPTTKDQCKNGAYLDFGGLFPNQGACVSYVARQ